MRVTGLDLECYRSYEEATVTFDQGVTVIHGANGAGKTTILEAILFGLYGARALDDATLADVVTQGADEASVHLMFTHEGDDYRIEREVSVSGTRASTRRAVLVEPGGERYEGASAIRTRVADLLRMDADAFVNSAYIKQGEINKLLHATPAERQSMIDELLQLGRLEDYRDRADEARLAVRSLARERAEVVEELERQRDRLAEPDPYDRLNELETELERLGGVIEELRHRRDTLASNHTALERDLESVAEKRDQLEALTERRQELASAIDDVEQRRGAIRTELAETRRDLRTGRDELNEQLTEAGCDDVDEVPDVLETVTNEIIETEASINEHRETIEAAREAHTTASDRQAELDDRINERERAIEQIDDQLEADIEVLDDRRSTVASLRHSLEETADALELADASAGTLEDALDTTESDLQDSTTALREVRDERAALAEHVEQAEALADADKCPTCAQPVSSSPHVEALATDRTRLEEVTGRIDELETHVEALEERRSTITEALERRDRLDHLKEVIDERESVISQRRERRGELERALEEAADEADALEEAIASSTDEIETAQEAIAEENQRLHSLRQQRDILEETVVITDRIEELEAAIERLDDRREHLDELADERSAQLADVDDRLREVQASLNDASADELQQELAEVEEQLDAVKQQLTAAQSKRDEFTEARGSVRADIERLEGVTEDLSVTNDRVAGLENLQDETVELRGLYESVRRDLRERNVTVLERLLNETFALLYRNEAYDRIGLDHGYELSIHSRDGAELDPTQLSGGERAIFNLSLRCAIYRLLAEGVDGAAPMPPLMLDEPTVFLDHGHVGRLIRLLETMRSFGVEQTLVVSHHESLLDAAEHRVAVEKDPTTNRSRIDEMVTPSPP